MAIMAQLNKCAHGASAGGKHVGGVCRERPYECVLCCADEGLAVVCLACAVQELLY